MAIVAWVDGVFWDDRGRAVVERTPRREVDMVRLWDDAMGVRAWDPGEGRGTVVYRGAEIVPEAEGFRVWFLPISSREGFIGGATSVAKAKRLVDRELDRED